MFKKLRSKVKKWARKSLRKVVAAMIGITVGTSAGTAVSSYKPIVEPSHPQRIQVVYQRDDTIPSNAIPAEAIPSNAIPSNAIPSNAIPSNAIPSNALPASAIPSNAIPAEAIPSNAIPAEIAAHGKFSRLPKFDKKVCGSGRCSDDTKYTYYSNQSGEELAGLSDARDAGEELAGPSQGSSGSISVQFYADSYALTKGECTNIHWDATGSNNVWINDVSSDINGVKQVCPAESTTYLIIAADVNNAQISSSLIIQVQEAVVASEPGEEIVAPDRCDLFGEMDMKVTYLDWNSGAPLKFHFKMPGGVPGLGKKVAGDMGTWNYSAQIGSYTSSNCEVIQGYEDRLYCTISLPSRLSNSLSTMTLNLNGCESPIYSNQTAFLPEIIDSGGGNKAGGGSGDNSDEGSSGSPGTEYGGPAGSCTSDLNETSCSVYGGTYITPFCTTSPCLPSFCACP